MPEGTGEGTGQGGSQGVVLDNGNQGGGGAGQTPNPSGGNENGTGGNTFEGLSEGNVSRVQEAGFKSGDALAESYFALRDKMSAGEHKEGQSNDGQSNVTAANSPADYQFTVPEGAADFGYSDDFANSFKDFAYQNKIPTETAAAMHDWFVNDAASAHKEAGQQATTDFDAALNATHDALSKEWGDPSTPGFNQQLDYFKRAATHLDPGMMDALRETGVVQKNANGQDVLMNATIAKALAKIGADYYREDSMFSLDNTGKNPFAKDSEDMAAQGRIFQQNPEEAKRLIKAAGVEQHWQHVFN